jgi:hypothetical protein
LWPGQFVAREVGWDLLKVIYWQIKIVFLARARVPVAAALRLSPAADSRQSRAEATQVF